MLFELFPSAVAKTFMIHKRQIKRKKTKNVKKIHLSTCNGEKPSLGTFAKLP